MAHKEQKQMLIDAIVDKKIEAGDSVHSYDYIDGYETACKDILELIEGIL